MFRPPHYLFTGSYPSHVLPLYCAVTFACHDSCLHGLLGWPLFFFYYCSALLRFVFALLTAIWPTGVCPSSWPTRLALVLLPCLLLLHPPALLWLFASVRAPLPRWAGARSYPALPLLDRPKIPSASFPIKVVRPRKKNGTPHPWTLEPQNPRSASFPMLYNKTTKGDNNRRTLGHDNVRSANFPISSNKNGVSNPNAEGPSDPT